MRISVHLVGLFSRKVSTVQLMRNCTEAQKNRCVMTACNIRTVHELDTELGWQCVTVIRNAGTFHTGGHSG